MRQPRSRLDRLLSRHRRRYSAPRDDTGRVPPGSAATLRNVRLSANSRIAHHIGHRVSSVDNDHIDRFTSRKGLLPGLDDQRARTRRSVESKESAGWFTPSYRVSRMFSSTTRLSNPSGTPAVAQCQLSARHQQPFVTTNTDDRRSLARSESRWIGQDVFDEVSRIDDRLLDDARRLGIDPHLDPHV